jgi:hypothetical protein
LFFPLFFAVSKRFEFLFSTDDAIGPSKHETAIFRPFPALFALYSGENRPMRENSTHNA